MALLFTLNFRKFGSESGGHQALRQKHGGRRFGRGVPVTNKLLALPGGAPILRALFPNLFSTQIMSQHRSLKTSGGSVGTKRSVLKRGERIKLMKARGQWKEGRLPTSLPKTKSE